MDGKYTLLPTDKGIQKKAQLFIQKGTGAYTIVKICWLNVHQMVLIQLTTLTNTLKHRVTNIFKYKA